MLRDKSLIPLSHQHQHALALCVRLDRAFQAGDVDTDAWMAELQQIFEQEIQGHFAAEEKLIFPAAEDFDDLRALVDELKQEHAAMRENFFRAIGRTLEEDELRTLGTTLSSHIRKEERQLFEGMQQRMSAEALASIGLAIEKEIVAPGACLLPNEATRLRPR